MRDCSERMCGIVVLVIVLLTVQCFAETADRDYVLGETVFILSSDDGKIGVKCIDETWLINPIYDDISFDGNVFWVFQSKGLTGLSENQMWLGFYNPNTGLTIPPQYDEIRIGQPLIVAWSSSEGWDVFDPEVDWIQKADKEKV